MPSLMKKLSICKLNKVVSLKALTAITFGINLHHD